MKTTINDRAAIAALIRARRIGQGLTLQSIADQLGVPRQRIAQIEAGQIAGIDYYLRCVEVLGGSVKVEWKKPG